MALVNCESCGKEISDQAKKCPHCENVPKAVRGIQAPCKQCGTMLHMNEHVTTAYSSGPAVVRDGNSVAGGSHYLSHKPCPKCGEPEPLKGVVKVKGQMLFPQLFMMLGMLIVGIVASIYFGFGIVGSILIVCLAIWYMRHETNSVYVLKK